jgi:DHA3 family macrolide efflux protein-like MFS transporter
MSASGPTRLFNRNFTLLWQAQTVSQIGNQLHAVAMMFWVKHATGSATLMGTLMMVAMLPGVLLGPLGGTLADRFSRRAIIVSSDLVRGLLVLSLAALLFLRPHATTLLVTWLFVIGISAAVLGAFFRPAISAAIPDLVPRERLPAANSLTQSTYQLTTFVGQGIGGTLFRLLGAPLLFLIDGLTYIACAGTEWFVRIPQRLPEQTGSARQFFAQFAAETRAGFSYVWEHRGLRSLFGAAALLNFLFSPIAVMMPFYVEDYLHTAPGVPATPDWLGFLLAALGVGSLIGYALAGVLRLPGRKRAALAIASLFLVCLTLGAAGLTNRAFAALALFLVMGVGSGIVNIGIATTLQLTTPTEIRGRVFGLLGTLAGGLTPIGMGLAGVVIDAVGHNIPLIFRICGLAATLVMVPIALDRSFWSFLAYDAQAESGAATDSPASPHTPPR